MLHAKRSLAGESAGSNFGDDWTGQLWCAHAYTIGEPCRSPAVINSHRCRMHGGAKG